MNKTEGDVIYLVSCALNDKVPEKKCVESMELEQVYAFANQHMISAVVAFALESAGYRDQRSESAIASAMRRTALFDRAWSSVKNCLENAGIWYMPMKGALLKSLYPKYGMREFSDHDILFDASRADDVKAVMEGLGFTTESFRKSNHDIYFKKPRLNFEMHRELFGANHDEKLYEYYKSAESRLISGDGYSRSFTPEDFYLYMTAHEYKHFSLSGTGLRSLMDTFVYLNSRTLNEEYVKAEAEKLGLKDFEEKNRLLSIHLFTGAELTETDSKMLDFILSSGTYGTIHNRIKNKVSQTRFGKLQYMLERFSVPIRKTDKKYSAYAEMYPFFYKHRPLLPLLPFYRTFRAIKQGRFQKEAKALRDVKL